MGQSPNCLVPPVHFRRAAFQLVDEMFLQRPDLDRPARIRIAPTLTMRFYLQSSTPASGFFRKSRPIMLNLSISVDDLVRTSGQCIELCGSVDTTSPIKATLGLFDSIWCSPFPPLPAAAIAEGGMTYDRAVSVNPAKCPKRTLFSPEMVGVVERIEYDCPQVPLARGLLRQWRE